MDGLLTPKMTGFAPQKRACLWGCETVKARNVKADNAKTWLPLGRWELNITGYFLFALETRTTPLAHVPTTAIGNCQMVNHRHPHAGALELPHIHAHCAEPLMQIE